MCIRDRVDEFIGAGHTVMGCSRSDAGMQELRELYGTPHEFAALDVSDDAAVKAWSAKCLKQYGAPDLLVNNAGVINEPANLVDVSDVEFRQVLVVNVSGVANMIRHVVPAMIDTQKNGIVINLSSGWGRSVSSGVAPYCASKWAIEGLTKALAEELPSGMAAVPLSPGALIPICYVVVGEMMRVLTRSLPIGHARLHLTFCRCLQSTMVSH